MFIAALFRIPKLWKQPRCPSTHEWMKKMRYLCTKKFYSAKKKSDTMSLARKRMELGNITLREVS
jgi:hypothetical protein